MVQCCLLAFAVVALRLQDWIGAGASSPTTPALPSPDLTALPFAEPVDDDEPMHPLDELEDMVPGTPDNDTSSGGTYVPAGYELWASPDSPLPSPFHSSEEEFYHAHGYPRPPVGLRGDPVPPVDEPVLPADEPQEEPAPEADEDAVPAEDEPPILDNASAPSS